MSNNFNKWFFNHESELGELTENEIHEKYEDHLADYGDYLYERRKDKELEEALRDT